MGEQCQFKHRTPHITGLTLSHTSPRVYVKVYGKCARHSTIQLEFPIAMLVQCTQHANVHDECEYSDLSELVCILV